MMPYDITRPKAIEIRVIHINKINFGTESNKWNAYITLVQGIDMEMHTHVIRLSLKGVVI